MAIRERLGNQSPKPITKVRHRLIKQILLWRLHEHPQYPKPLLHPSHGIRARIIPRKPNREHRIIQNHSRHTICPGRHLWVRSDLDDICDEVGVLPRLEDNLHPGDTILDYYLVHFISSYHDGKWISDDYFRPLSPLLNNPNADHFPHLETVTIPRGTRILG